MPGYEETGAVTVAISGGCSKAWLYRLLAALVGVAGLLALGFAVLVGVPSWIGRQPEPARLLLGDSMTPTLQNFDIVSLRPPRELRRGQIVSYWEGDHRVCHRIVGLPGETVAVQDGPVVIGEGDEARVLDAPYTLAADQYVTQGDHRASGAGEVRRVVSQSKIVGIVHRIVFPPWRVRFLPE